MARKRSGEHTKTDFSMPMNVIDGIPFPPFVRHKRIEELKQWIPRPDDVYIVSYPKSGSTWLRHIVKLIKNNGIDDGVEIFTAIKWLAADRNELEKCKVQSTLLELS